MLMMTMGHVPTAWAQGQIFVTNYHADSITVYSRNSNGDVAPAFTILGQSGDSPHHVAINHRAGELIVTNNIPYSVTTFDWVTGARKRTVAGPSTGLTRPTGVAIDEVNGEIYVANEYGNSITVYDVLAAGDVAPKRTIKSAELLGVSGVAIDLAHDEIVVTTLGYHSILTFARLANGESIPKRRIYGLKQPVGIALNLVNDEIVVANSAFSYPNEGAILTFRRTDDGFNVVPIRRVEGSATSLCNPIGVAVDVATNELVVANSNFGGGSCAWSVTTHARTATGNAPPKRIVTGALTGLYYPVAPAITSASSLSLKVRATQSSVTAGANVGYAIDATANGGPLFNVALTDQLPSGLAWSLSGTNTSSCTLSPAPESKLACSFGNLLKGETRSILVTAVSTTSSCPGFTNQATASFNDGTAQMTGVSLATITIRCK